MKYCIKIHLKTLYLATVLTGIIPTETFSQPSDNRLFSRTVSDQTNPLASPGTELTNQKFKNTLFENCTFTNGLVNIKGIDSLYFYKCTFINYGVKLGDATTHNIIFDRCNFINVTENGIVTVISNSSDHYDLVIKNSYFEGWGKYNGISTCSGEIPCNPKFQDCERCNDPYNKFDHGIYLRATDAIVEKCSFYHTTGGSAISVRNSATVRSNKIYSNQTGVGSGIGYWPQYKSKGSKRLQIHNNVIIGYAQDTIKIGGDQTCGCGNAFRSLVHISCNQPGNIVDSLEITFNTLIVLDSLENPKFSVIDIDKRYMKNTSSIYGNLLVDTRASPNLFSVALDTSLNKIHFSLDIFQEIKPKELIFNTRLDSIDSMNYQFPEELFSQPDSRRPYGSTLER